MSAMQQLFATLPDAGAQALVGTHDDTVLVTLDVEGTGEQFLELTLAEAADLAHALTGALKTVTARNTDCRVAEVRAELAGEVRSR